MEFVDYKKFVEEDHAQALAEVLKDKGIACEITGDRESLDSLYGDKIFKKEFFVKIRRADFGAADALLLEISKTQLDQADPEHYLFKFSDEELEEVLEKQDEWNEFDIQLAQKILKDRGREIKVEQLQQLKSQRLKALAQPQKPSPFWVAVGYFLAFIGGPLGVISGWHISTHKKTLPNGERVYAFTAGDRNHGKNILILGIVMLVIWISYGILRQD